MDQNHPEPSRTWIWYLEFPWNPLFGSRLYGQPFFFENLGVRALAMHFHSAPSLQERSGRVALPWEKGHSQQGVDSVAEKVTRKTLMIMLVNILDRLFNRVISTITSSTAQGGGGSFKNRKPIGKVGCCESGMAERIHWWIERWLMSPLFLSLSLTIYLPTYLSSMYLSIYLSIYLSLSLSFICLSV